jgi:hypothetical protein
MPVGKVAQRAIEVLEGITPVGKASQRCVEVLWAYTAPSPTTITGGGVSQRTVEVLLLASSPSVRVGQRCVEVLVSGDGAAGGSGPGTPVTTAYGYAV